VKTSLTQEAAAWKGEFMAGVNVQGDDLREFPERIVELLKSTPISWVRVHLLPTRRLEEKGRRGLTYLDGLEVLCKSGYNILAPIDVGYAENVGVVPEAGLDAFIADSYQFSFDAAEKLAEVGERHKVKVLYGVENEIDPKSCLLQALPEVSWRGSFEVWAAMALEPRLKYQRLANIARGITDAVPGARLTTSLDAEDATDVVDDVIEHMSRRHQKVLDRLAIPVDEVEDRVIDWRAELACMKGKLDLDIVGLDSYPNYLFKYPVLGGEIGLKVDDAEKISGIPVFNPEFGYSTYRNILERVALGVSRRPSSEKMQAEFFRNALESIGRSGSRGVFPWVLLTHVDRPEKPAQEAYFGLFAMKGETLTRRQAFDRYVEWLRGRTEGARP
jgi:hypothetical protein